MAKSLRSKFKRKIRAIARVKKAPKEAERLNKVIQCSEAYKKKVEEENVELSKLAPGTNEPVDMDTNSKPVVSTLNLKTMKTADGKYPVWMNQKARNKYDKAAKKEKSRKKQKNRARR
ncbi:unnamed protein product [Auanema sp. JU1783]|nr:unnamed protein product [Auanema sp. JU1783]